MSHDSGEENIDPVLQEEIDDGPTASPVGGKRRRTQATTSTVPSQPRKKPAHRSPVWEHFIQQAHDQALANCRYCGQALGCDTVIHGTSAMKNHISRCKMYKMHLESGTQSVLAGDSSGVMTAIKYDQALFRRSVNEMIVLNELPFAFVESEGFRRFCSNMLPMYTVHCRKTATTDIYSMYLREKGALKELFGKEKQRVSMTTDIWVAPTTSCSYMVVTAHWIDRDWKLQKRIISFKPVTDHKGDTIAEHLVACLEEWGIEKVFTVTVDNAKGNDKALRVFTDALIMRGPDALVSNGDYLHMRCCAHVLNLIVRDGLSKAKRSIVSIRNAIKYVRSSGDRLKSFLLRVDTGNVGRGSLCLDVATRWNSTYLMARTVTALGLDFDVLSWWGRNSSKFPVLSELARDILVVQVSSVASESAFSTSGRILDPYRSSMSPFMVESLVCTQQWLRNTIQAEKLASLVQMFEELQFHESLATQNATHPIADP